MSVISYKGIEQLTEDNYESWSLKVYGYCMGQGWAAKVLEAEEPQEAGPKAEWVKLNAQCYAFLCQTISPTQLLAYRGIYNAKEIWTSLRTRYKVTSEAKKVEFFDELAKINWQEGESLQAYFTRVRTVKQKCEEVGRQVSSHEVCFYLLRGVTRPEFDVTKSVLRQNAKLTLQEAELALLERERECSSVLATDAVKAYAVDKRSGVKPRSQRFERKCWGCGSSDHELKSCPKKAKQSKITCFSCGGEGHVSRVCPSNRPGKAREANLAASKGEKKSSKKSQQSTEANLTTVAKKKEYHAYSVDRSRQKTVDRSRQKTACAVDGHCCF